LTLDDVIHRHRVRLFALARELGNVRQACRVMGVHPSTYYRWRREVLAWGLEALRPRERRRPRMPNQLPAHVEHRILAFSLAFPGLGPRRISAELARERWGAIVVSPNGVYRCLVRHGLSTRKAWQGLERKVMIVVHPLSGVGSPSAFDLETGRLCVMAPRHRAGLIVLSRDHVRRTLEDYIPSAEQPVGRPDVVGRGHNDHLEVWERLSSDRRPLALSA